jgi:hypothetical protein
MLSCWHMDDEQRPMFEYLRDAFSHMIEGADYLYARNSVSDVVQ